MRPERVQAIVIGGGVVGCSLLRELAQRGIESVLLEAEPEVGLWASRGNSGIIHSGFDAVSGTLEARLLRRAAQLWPGVVNALDVPYRKVGALMVARNERQRAAIRQLADRASAMGVTVQLIGRDVLHDRVAFLSHDVLAGLVVPDEAIVDPWALTRAYADAARAAGARIVLGVRVTALDVGERSVHVRTEDGTEYVADQVFDCAGLQADEVARLAGDDGFTIRPRKGEFLVVRETGGVDRIVLPVPGPMGKGTLVAPILAGGLLLGPTARDVDDKTDRSVATPSHRRIVDACAAMVPAVRHMATRAEFAGLRTVSSTGGSVIRPSVVGDRLWLLAGIRSTGVSISPALAETVTEQVVRLRGWQEARAAAPRATVSPAR